MAKYAWPEAKVRKQIGKRISRVDGHDKVSGKAKYTYDIHRPDMLYGKILHCPYAHAKIKQIDITAAEAMPGVKAIRVIAKLDAEVFWAGEELVSLAAIDEATAEDAIRAIKVEYEVLPHQVVDTPMNAPGIEPKSLGVQTSGDSPKAFKKADVVVEGEYGMPVITHCCMEAHGTVAEWTGEDLLLAHVSTQNVSGIAVQFAKPLRIPAANVQIKQEHIGGGFGSKFGPDRWGIESARLSKMAGKPVKMMLNRDAELMIAGARPSCYAKVKIGAEKDGTLTAWESISWGTDGMGGGGQPPLPYLFEKIPHQKKEHFTIQNNMGSARAWRAPNHPQACLVTMGAIDDLAAKLNKDPVDVLLKNIELTGNLQEIYIQELKIAADLIEWKKNWHPRKDPSPGVIKRGLGVAMHTWGGRGHGSNCEVAIHPDASVTVKLGTQDLGTGTRTAIAVVAAEVLGLPVEAIRVMIGDSQYPPSGGSGGSTTVGGVSAATLRAAMDVSDQLFAKIAPVLETTPDDLESVEGTVRSKRDPGRSMTWRAACAKLGGLSISAVGKNPGDGKLTDGGVGGVQMADVSVDIETGVVRLNKMVAVQDCGLILDLKTAESQCYGGMIMGICYALYEEKIMDPLTGRMLNPNMEFYKLAGLSDVGELVVHMLQTPEVDKLGVIGLGEPPVISPGAAISNAVANAIGVRVPYLPLTPDRVLAALYPKEV